MWRLNKLIKKQSGRSKEIGKFTIGIFIFVLVNWFFSACFLPTSSTTVSGRVTEYGEKPVAGAKISGVIVYNFTP